MVADNRGRGGRGNRKRNKRNKQHHHHQGPKKINVPLPAQTKLVWRNISNVEKYGTVEKVLQMVQKVVTIANEKNGNQYTIDMDRSAMRYLIQEEELANKYAQDFKASQEANEETKEEEGEKTETVAVNPIEETKEEIEEAPLDVVVAPKQHSSIPLITARPLYVNPPRKTRRHGEKVGCAYILLTAPKIEKIEVPTPSIPPEIMEVEVVPEEEENKAEKATTEEPTESQAAEAAKSEEDTMEEEAAATAPMPAAEETKEVETPAKPEEKQTSAMLEHQAAINKALAADYSTAVAKGRLLVSRAIEFLSNIASEDAKGSQDFAGCRIDTAMSGKTWRHQYRADRREGTIETTNEYKNWLNSLTKKKEELESRPKPAPGGGAASSNLVAGLVDSSQDQAQPVAAIVQHLRAKRQELKRKKTKKKKEKNDKAGGKNKKKDGGRAAQGGGGKKKKKKGGGGGKKKGGGGGKKPTTPTIAPPTALLKPGVGGVAR